MDIVTRRKPPDRHKVVHNRLSKLHRSHAAPILDMLKFELLVSGTLSVNGLLGQADGSLLLALGVEINSSNTSGALIEADIVEALETCPGDGFDLVIGNQEVFFPTHEEMIVLRVVLESEAW